MPTYRFHELAIESPVELPELVEIGAPNRVACPLQFDIVDEDQLHPIDDGEEMVQQRALGTTGTILGFAGGIEFIIPTSADHLIVRHVRSADPATTRHILLDQALPRLLARRGLFTAHASGVDHHGKTLIFLGASGNGKSSMAAGLHRAGFPLLGDDCFTLTPETDGTVTALSTYRSLRLLPESVEQFYGDEDRVEFSSMGAGYDKVRVLEPAIAEPRPQPVAGIFLLDGLEHVGAPEAVQLSGRDGMLALVQHSFRVNATDGAVLGDALDLAHDIVRQVQILALRYERSFDQLDQVHRAIFDSIS